MGPYEYLVEKIDGDYAFLRRTDIESDDRMQVARALLPEETDEGTRLRWENLCYTVLEG
ncbi:MAG: chorismate--pyruvate lyase [Clostridia bacterium]|nr:chorismate--pyruvate lyase [Clostridia bacterium]MDD7484392.1 chorismate--pyruvate lyase [Clostridia bacterium]MDY5559055.1 chorismate--pyruvate lyase [Candidatus Heritagella sp.]